MALENDELELDVENLTPEKIDQGGRLGPGMYLVTLNDMMETADDKKIFEFAIADGPLKGIKLKYYLPDPSTVYDDVKHKTALARYSMIAKRLGVLTDEMIQQKAADPSFKLALNWLDAIGREVWVEVDYGKDESGQTSVFANITYGGIWPVGHKELQGMFKRWEKKGQKGLPSEEAGFSAAWKRAGAKPAEAAAVATAAGATAAPARADKWASI